MRISVFGLGYVGSVTAACVARDGHSVIGVDLYEEKVEAINRGKAPVVEPGLDELMAKVVRAGRLRATVDAELAIRDSDLALICVGTPSATDGSLDVEHLAAVSSRIGAAIRDRADHFTVVVRSTVLPGTTRDVVVPAIESTSGRIAHVDFDVCVNPEFLREGSSLTDYSNPSRIVIGTDDGKPNHLMNRLYADLKAPWVETHYEVAEIIKYVDNSWHALKVAFANEVGRVSKLISIDALEVMEIMAQDTTLNISAKYLRPGFAFGGSCLPKDVSALSLRAQELGVDVPLIKAIMSSNDAHIQSVVNTIVGVGNQKVGCLGLSFKPQTDDLRNSPTIAVIEQLLAQGFDLRVHDPSVNVRKLVGANHAYLASRIPIIERIIVSTPQEVMDFGDTIILTKPEPSLMEYAMQAVEGQCLVDLVGLSQRPPQGEYVGIAW